MFLLEFAVLGHCPRLIDSSSWAARIAKSKYSLNQNQLPMPVANNSLIHGLERGCFLGENIFERETQRIYSRNWICVGRMEDLGSDGDEWFRTF